MLVPDVCLGSFPMNLLFWLDYRDGVPENGLWGWELGGVELAWAVDCTVDSPWENIY